MQSHSYDWKSLKQLRGWSFSSANTYYAKPLHNVHKMGTGLSALRSLFHRKKRTLLIWNSFSLSFSAKPSRLVCTIHDVNLYVYMMPSIYEKQLMRSLHRWQNLSPITIGLSEIRNYECCFFTYPIFSPSLVSNFVVISLRPCTSSEEGETAFKLKKNTYKRQFQAISENNCHYCYLFIYSQ